MNQYHMIGIKGTGMSALANILASLGHDVQGSDIDTYVFTEEALVQSKIPILPFDRGNIKPGLEIIAGNAFKDEHVEISECIYQNIPVMRYHHFLAKYLSNYKSIAITGTHGKTTTTGLLNNTYKNIYPTIGLIGDGTGIVSGSSPEYFIFESCEYRNHFLSYEPDIAVITNIDFDHPDFFQSIDDVINSFQKMVNRVKGKLVMNGDDDHIKKLNTADKNTVTFGFGEHNDIIASNIQTKKSGTKFDVHYNKRYIGAPEIRLFGRHNVMNALAAISVCISENIDPEIFIRHLSLYTGAKRRFVEKQIGDRIVIDDYAHHPTAIKATIRAAREKYGDGKKIISVFEPHTYKRFVTFLDQFAESLSLSDKVYICPISRFGIRPQHADYSVDELVQRITEASILQFDDIEDLLAYDNAVFLFMGVGQIQNYIETFERTARQRGLLNENHRLSKS